jgi:hypothetical protein
MIHNRNIYLNSRIIGRSIRKKNHKIIKTSVLGWDFWNLKILRLK